MFRKLFFKITFLFFPLLAATTSIHLLAQAKGGYTVYLPIFARSSSCNAPSANHPTIQSAVDDGCYIINLTAALYVENILIQGHSVIIRGQGPANTTIDGNATDSVFKVQQDSELTLEGVTVRNGYNDDTYPEGGGIQNKGVTHLFNTVIKENSTDFSPGGGIHSNGTLTVENSWIIDNYLKPTSTFSRGGGVFVLGTAHFTNTTISGNVAYDGGGIYVVGNSVVTIVNSEILDNEGRWGGGLFSYGGATVLISNSLVSGNKAKEGGGGIFNAANMQIIDSRIIGNTVVFFSWSCGGGIMNSGDSDYAFERGVLLVDRTEIRDNVSFEIGAGICNNNRYFADPIGEVEIYNSLFVGNSVMGPIWDGGGGFYSRSVFNAIIENSTLTNNTANFNGGAILADNLQLINVTVTQNDAPNGGGVYSWANVQMVNSIVVGNLSGGNCGVNSGAQLTSLGYNIASDNTCNLNGPGDMPNTDPLLGPLQNNGGPTQTTALLPDSPAIDTANNAACPPTDQRGVIRPQGSDCDIGAYEFNG